MDSVQEDVTPDRTPERTLVHVQFGDMRGDYRASAVIRFLPEELSERHDINWSMYDQDGLGPAVGVAFRAANGELWGLEHLFYPRRFGKRGSAIVTHYESPLEAETIDLALGDLELTTNDLIGIREDLHFTPRELVRQDDHGNQFVVGSYRCQADALAMQRQLTATFHKQEYWIRVAKPGSQPG